MFAQRKIDTFSSGASGDFSLTASSSATTTPSVTKGRQSLIATIEPLSSLLASIASLCELRANWDGNDSAAPTEEIGRNAANFLQAAFDEAICAGCWALPLISASEEGAIVFEWWNLPRKLTVYVAENDLSYVKSWGSDMTTEMEDGPMHMHDVGKLLRWLTGWE